jgi:hypothetical protein
MLRRGTHGYASSPATGLPQGLLRISSLLIAIPLLPPAAAVYVLQVPHRWLDGDASPRSSAQAASGSPGPGAERRGPRISPLPVVQPLPAGEAGDHFVTWSLLMRCWGYAACKQTQHVALHAVA